MDATEFRLSEFLPYRLAVLAERISRRLSVEYGRLHGLSVAEWRIMAHLSQGGPVSVKDIHLAANLDKPRVSRAVARLSDIGFVDKRTGDGDGRLVAISLTTKGRAAFAEILPAVMTLEAALKDSVSGEDLATFLNVLERMHATLDEDSRARPRYEPPGDA